MSQENKPRFSHITIGQGPHDEAAEPDEEVITIGAVDALSGESKSERTHSSFTGVDGVKGSQEPANEQPIGHDAHDTLLEQKHSDDEDLGLGEAMPTAQKIVLACCAIGFIVAIVLVIWYWISPH